MAGKTRKVGRKTRGGMCGMKHKKGSGYKKSKKHGGKMHKKHKKGGMGLLSTLKQALPSYLLYQAVKMQQKKKHSRKTKGGKKHKTHKKRKMHKSKTHKKRK